MDHTGTETITCHGCNTSKRRRTKDPRTGSISLQTTLREWKWLMLQSQCYCTECSPQALADEIDSLWEHLRNLPRSNGP